MDPNSKTKQRCSCWTCRTLPDLDAASKRNVIEASQRLAMIRDERELRVGMAGARLLAGNVSDFT